MYAMAKKTADFSKMHCGRFDKMDKEEPA